MLNSEEDSFVEADTLESLAGNIELVLDIGPANVFWIERNKGFWRSFLAAAQTSHAPSKAGAFPYILQ